MTVLESPNVPACGCDADHLLRGLATVDEALKLALSLVNPLKTKRDLALDNCLGSVLAEPAKAQTMMPPFDNSGMDGYAVRIADFTGDGPWTLPISNRIAAGDASDTALEQGTANRIFTGAPTPVGADAVIMQEAVASDGQKIVVMRRPKTGQNIRLKGGDLIIGTTILEAGTKLGPRQIAAAAGAGYRRLSVYTRPRVAILCTGNEVVTSDAPLTSGKICDVNGPMLNAALVDAGAEVITLAHIADCPDTMTREFEKMSKEADLIISTGGVSVGDEDHVKGAVEAAGGQIDLAGVAIKPGKPVTFGRIGKAVFLGLPGNPVSAYVTWSIFGAPMLQKLGDGLRATPARRHVVADIPIAHKKGRCEYRPASLVGHDSLGRDVIITDPKTQSAHLAPMAGSDGLVVIPGDVERIPPGDLLEFIPFQS